MKILNPNIEILNKFEIQNSKSKTSFGFTFLVCVFCFLFLIFGFSMTASASYISLNTTLSSKVEGKTLKVKISVVNKGDESAYNVQAELRVKGKEILAEKKTELPVNGTYQAEKSISLPLLKPGAYPLILVMHYTDANQYPFSALTGQTFVYQKEAVSPIFGRLKPATFSKEGTLKLALKNLSNTEVKAKTYLVAPRELTVEEKISAVTLAPKSEESSSFIVKNFSALAGSTYQVFAVSEAEDQDLHYTSISPGTVKIIASQEIFGLNYTVIFAILIALTVVFIAAQFIRKK